MHCLVYRNPEDWYCVCVIYRKPEDWYCVCLIYRKPEDWYCALSSFVGSQRIGTVHCLVL